MVIDSSALIAIIGCEPEMELFAAIVADHAVVRLSAASYVEASMVLATRGKLPNQGSLDEFLRRYEIHIEPLTEEHAKLAADAFRKYGKGIHPAALNFGDCLTYALAKATREPLLFKGNDFIKTDLTPARKPTQ